MSLYTDNNVIQADIARRYELAGVDRHDTHHHDRHPHDLPARPVGLHPLTAWVARLLSGSTTASRQHSQRHGTVAAGRPRHP